MSVLEDCQAFIKQKRPSDLPRANGYQFVWYSATSPVSTCSPFTPAVPAMVTRGDLDSHALPAEIRNPHGIPVRVFLLPMMTSYFLWHLPQFAASPALKAFVPLWHAPQNLPALMSAIVMVSPPFFILKRPD